MPAPDAVSSRSLDQSTSPGLALGIQQAFQGLSRAARSFALYDAHNDAVKQIIADFKEKSSVLIRNAPMELDICPFEILLGQTVVFHDDDRERSLPFRLFRDGARKLKFEHGLTWSDLVSLLEVLSVRSISVRSQEDDLVTLLRKAEFQRIVVESVEGYLPDEENPEAVQLVAATMEAFQPDDPPADWDLPIPEPGDGGKVQFREVDPDALDALRSEEKQQAVPAQAVRAVTEMLGVAHALGDTSLQAELLPFLEEVQEYLLVEHSLDALAALAATWQKLVKDGRPLPALQDERAFAKLLQAVPEDSDVVPPNLFRLLAAVPGDHLRRSLDMLALEPRGALRTALLQIVHVHAARDPRALLAWLPGASPVLARDLFTILGETAPDRRVDAAFDLLGHPDPAFQLELLAVLATAPRGLKLVRALQRLMDSPHEHVRVRACDALGSIGGSRAVPLLVHHANNLAAVGMTPAEAMALGQALGSASPEDAKPFLLEWIRPPAGLRTFMGRFAKETHEERILHWTAVAGLELCPGADSEQAIEAVKVRAAAPLALRCQRALAALRGGDDRE